MAISPQYASTVRCSLAQVSTANANRDGTGTLVDVFTSGANGSRIDKIRVNAVAATTAGMVRLFINNGVTNQLFCEIPVTNLTPAASLPAFNVVIGIENMATFSQVLPLLLPTGYTLRASTNNAEVFNIQVEGGDF